MSPISTCHVPVLSREVLQWLDPQPGQVVIDGTLGGGGHSRLLAARVGAQGRVIALDRDPLVIQRAALDAGDLPIQPIHANFSDLAQVLEELSIESVDAVLLDLGLSSDQLADLERGFSFDSSGPLDLRFDPTQGEPAWRILQRTNTEDLANIIYQYGEERFSRRIARAIVDRRSSDPIHTANQLAELVRSCVPRSRDRIDPATRTFQALRIAVNRELDALKCVLDQLPRCLRPGGRAAIISFHSLEDRIVKHTFRDDPRWDVVTKKPIRPADDEVAANPRSRSARMRVASRIE